MGRRPKARGRDVHGVVLLNKEYGASSNQALQRVKRLFNANRAGHTGALDPMATGLLPICLGEASKLSAYLLNADKGYQARIVFGSSTDTGDALGTVNNRAALPANWQQKLEQLAPQLIGTQLQIPPMYSALKQQGQALYKLAREGIEVARTARQIEIYSLEINNLGENYADISVRCSKGSYMRSLAEDIGKAVGTLAHLGKLHRDFAAPFHDQHCLRFGDLCAQAQIDEQDFLQPDFDKSSIDFANLDKLIIPAKQALTWQHIEVDSGAAKALQHGARLSGFAYTDGDYLISYQGELLCLGHISAQILRCTRLLHIVPSMD